MFKINAFSLDTKNAGLTTTSNRNAARNKS